MDKICGENWSNFEEALAHIDFSNKFPAPNHKENETEDEDNELMKDYLLYMDMLTSGFIQCTRCWQEFLKLWIREVQIQIKPEVYSAKDNLRKIFKDSDTLFFTFNYTKTLQKLYKIKNVTHIHNSSFLDDMVMSFRKDTDFSIIRCKKFFKSLDYNIDKVYSYGFSYGDVDSVYIKHIVSKISSEAVWYFTAFEASDADELKIKKNKLRNYGFKGTFGIYEG